MHSYSILFTDARTLLVAERAGRLRVIKDGVLQPKLGALNGNALWRVTFSNPKPQQVEQREVLLTSLNTRVRDVIQGPDGNLYFATENESTGAAPTGTVQKIETRSLKSLLSLASCLWPERIMARGLVRKGSHRTTPRGV